MVGGKFLVVTQRRRTCNSTDRLATERVSKRFFELEDPVQFDKRKCRKSRKFWLNRSRPKFCHVHTDYELVVK